MSEELRAREVLAKAWDLGGFSETGKRVRAGRLHDADLVAIAAMLSFASSAAGQREGWKPIAWVSPGQMAEHTDRPPGEGGRYLPVRLTRDGNFTMPLYASPSAPEERRDEVERLREAVKIATDALAIYAAPEGYFDALGELHEANDDVHPGKLAERVLAEVAALTPYPREVGMGNPTEIAREKPVGPALHLKASCYSCRYERSERYSVQGDSGRDVYCDHPAQPGRTVGDSRWDTPDWCPEGDRMLAVREALLASPTPKDHSHD